MSDERRKNELLKTVVAPILIASVVGISSSYINSKLALEKMATRMDYMEKDVVSLKDILQAVHNNQLQLAERGQWMNNIEHRLHSLEKEKHSH